MMRHFRILLFLFRVCLWWDSEQEQVISFFLRPLLMGEHFILMGQNFHVRVKEWLGGCKIAHQRLQFAIWWVPSATRELLERKIVQDLWHSQKQQARKFQATLDGCNPKLCPLTDSLTGVKCRAISVAKNDGRGGVDCFGIFWLKIDRCSTLHLTMFGLSFELCPFQNFQRCFQN